MAEFKANNKQVAKNTLMLYTRMFLTMAISLYTSRVVLKELGIDDYGLYNVIGGFVVMLAFLNGAMSVASQRFIATEIGKDNGDITTVFSHVFYAHLFIAAIVIPLAETVGLWFLYNKMVIPTGMSNQAFWVYQSSIVIFISSILATPYNAAILAYEKMTIYAYVSLFTVIAKLLVAYSLVFIVNQKLIWYSIEIMLMSVFCDCIYIFYCWKHFALCKISGVFNRDIFKEINSFAGWSIFGAVAWAAKSQGLNILLNLFFSSAVNAAYGICNQVNTAVNSFVQNFNTAVNPQIFKTYVSTDFSHLNKLIFFGCKVSFLLLWLIAYPVYLNIDAILSFWLIEIPPYTSSLVKLILIVSMLESFTYSLGTSIQATGKITTYQVLVGLTIFLNIPISYILLKMGYSCEIVLIVSIFISVVTLIERLWLVKKLIPSFSLQRYIKNVFGRAVAVALSSYVLISAINKLGLLYPWWLNIMLCVMLSACSVWLLGLTDDERLSIKLIIKNKILRNG